MLTAHISNLQFLLSNLIDDVYTFMLKVVITNSARWCCIVGLYSGLFNKISCVDVKNKKDQNKNMNGPVWLAESRRVSESFRKRVGINLQLRNLSDRHVRYTHTHAIIQLYTSKIFASVLQQQKLACSSLIFISSVEWQMHRNKVMNEKEMILRHIRSTDFLKCAFCAKGLTRLW